MHQYQLGLAVIVHASLIIQPIDMLPAPDAQVINRSCFEYFAKPMRKSELLRALQAEIGMKNQAQLRQQFESASGG